MRTHAHAKHWCRVNFVRRSAAGSNVGCGIPASLRDQRSIGVPPCAAALNLMHYQIAPDAKTSEETSTWLALRNPVFRRLWLAMAVSGSCIRSPQHSCVFCVALAGCQNRASLTDGHGFGAAVHPVHLTHWLRCRYGRPQKDFVRGSILACHHACQCELAVTGK